MKTVEAECIDIDSKEELWYNWKDTKNINMVPIQAGHAQFEKWLIPYLVQ